MSSLIPLAWTAAFQWSNRVCTFPLAQQVPKLLGEGEGGRNRRITLAELINESVWSWCAMLGRTNDHERGTARQKGLCLSVTVCRLTGLAPWDETVPTMRSMVRSDPV